MELKHLLEAVAKRKVLFITTFVLIFAAAISVLLLMPPVYRSTSRIVISETMPEEDKDAPDVSIVLPQEGSFVESQIDVLKDTAIVNEVIKNLDLRDKKGNKLTPADLLKRIKISGLKELGMLLISVDAPAPREASNISNEMARQYVKWASRMNARQNDSLIKYVNDEMVRVKDALARTEKAMAGLTKKGRQPTLNETVTDSISKQVEIEIEKSRLDLEIFQLRSRMATQDNVTKIADASSKRKQLDSLASGFDMSITDLPERTKKFAGLMKDMRVGNGLYAMLSQMHDQINVSGAVKAGYANMISLSSAKKEPFLPNRSAGLIFSLAASLMIAAAAIIMREYFDSTIRNIRDAEEALRLPILELPAVKLGAPGQDPMYLVSVKKGPQDILEAVKHVCSDIWGTGTDKQILVFTSSLNGEGTSFVVSNLACWLALSGKRTLVIDLDHASPSQGQIFNIKALTGFSELVNGQIDLDGSISGSTIDKLSVLTAGSAMEIPQGKELAAKISDVFAQLRQRFDNILVDAPDIKSRLDLADLASCSDGAVLVIGSSVASRETLKEAAGMMAAARTMPVKCVFTSIIREGPVHHSEYRKKARKRTA